MKAYSYYKGYIHDWFERPTTVWARLFQVLIFVLIGFSLVSLGIEYFAADWFASKKGLFDISEYVVLAVFTIEYVLRFIVAPKKKAFVVAPMNVIDLLAILPTYLEFFLPLFMNTSGVRGLRLVRLLRFSRVLRVFKLLRYDKLFAHVLRYKETILETIMPVMMFLLIGKTIVVLLESFGFWIRDPALGELFAIIGFVLGIVLGQKISSTYEKFLQVEEAVTRLYGTLYSLEIVLKQVGSSSAFLCRRWAHTFLTLLHSSSSMHAALDQMNAQLYAAIYAFEGSPAELAILHGDLCRDSFFCLSKKERLTPKAYDTLLHQIILLYLVLLVLFVPGVIGLLSVFVATYTLYGMYNLTQDFDSIVGGDFSLINIEIHDLEQFAGFASLD